MRLFYVRPELPGSISRNSVFDRSVQALVLLRLHYELDYMPEDALFTSHPAFVVSAEAKAALLKAKFTGCEFDEVEISTSPIYIGRYGDEDPGEFFWFKVIGEALKDDFGIHKESRGLVVSEAALEVLEGLGISCAEIGPIEE